MDLSKIPTKDLEYIKAGQLDKVSTSSLQELAKQRGTPVAPSLSVMEPTPYNKVAEFSRAIAQGLTLNWADELEAALRTGSISNQDYQQLVGQLRAQQGQFRKDQPITGGTAEFAGGMALPAAAVMRPITKGAGIATDVAIGSSLGGISGAGTAERPEDVAGQALIGSLLGGGASGALSGLGRLAAPNIRPEAATLREQGVPLTPGSAFGGRIQQIEQSAESLPIVGGIVSGARQKQFEQFNVAAYNKILSNIDPKLKVPQGLTGRDAYNFVEKAVSDQYEKAVPNLRVSYDSRIEKGFDAIKKRYSGTKLPKDLRDSFTQYVDALKSDFSASQVISGRRAQAIKQDLREIGNAYAKETGEKRLLADAYKDLQGLYMAAMRNQNPQFANDLRKADKAFVDFARAQTAMAKTRGEEGVFTPAQLESAVRQSDKSARKGAFARGAAPMQELAGRGTSILGQKVPDSGTASRGMTGALLTGGASYVDPLAGGLTALMTAPYYRLGEKAMFSPRPASFTEAVQRARAASPFAVPGLLGLVQ
jgi:hypothetical protein